MRMMAWLLAVVAALSTLAMVPVVVSLRPMSGPDAMGLFLVLVVAAVQWLAVTGLLTAVSGLDAWAWLGPSRSARLGLLLGFQVVVGLAAFAALVLATGPDSASVRGWAVLFCLVFPATVIGTSVAAVTGLSLSPAVWRGAATVATIALAWGGLSMWQVERTRSAVVQQRLDRDLAERNQVHRAAIAALEAMPANAPLEAWLPWLDVSHSDLVERAVAQVRARPTLTEDLAQMLRGPEAVRALRFIWLWLPEPRPELAGPVRDALASLPPWSARALDASPAPTTDDAGLALPPAPRRLELSSVCESAVAVATYYEPVAFDLASPLRAWLLDLEARALPEERYAEDPTRTCRDFLRGWLAEHAR